jgi:hypothetical protein
VLAVHCRAGLGYTSAYFSIRQHTSAYVRMRQHASAYVSILLAYSKRRALCLSTVARASGILYMCLHATKYVSACYYICARMLLYVCRHATIFESGWYYMCPHATIDVSAATTMCPHASACYYICARMLLYTCPHIVRPARIARYLSAGALLLESLCRYATVHVVPQRRRCCYNLCVLMQLYMCVLMLLYMCAHTQAHGDADCAVPHGALRLQGAGGDSMAARRNAWLRARRAATVPDRL